MYGLGAGITASSQAVGGAINMGVDAHTRNQAWSRQKRAMQEKYQWAVRDLKAAGLNPILAATGGISPGAAPNVATSSTGGFANVGMAGAAGSQAETAKDKKGSEIAKNQALQGAAEAQGAKAREEALNAGEQRSFIRASAEKAQHDAKSADLMRQRIEAELPYYQLLGETYRDFPNFWKFRGMSSGMRLPFGIGIDPKPGGRIPDQSWRGGRVKDMKPGKGKTPGKNKGLRSDEEAQLNDYRGRPQNKRYQR